MSFENYKHRIPDEIHTEVLFEARKSCYKARDAFYSCLEKESDKKPRSLLYPPDCQAARAVYVKSCRASWVTHFDRLYCRNRRLNRLLDDKESRRGPLSLPQTYTFKPTIS